MHEPTGVVPIQTTMKYIHQEHMMLRSYSRESMQVFCKFTLGKSVFSRWCDQIWRKFAQRWKETVYPTISQLREVKKYRVIEKKDWTC